MAKTKSKKKPAPAKSKAKGGAKAKPAKPAKKAAKPAKAKASKASKPKAAKPKATAAKTAKSTKAKPKAGKPKTLKFAAVDNYPAWNLVDTGTKAFEIVYEPDPKKLKPFAKPKAVLEGHTNFVQGLAFSPDGKLFVTSSEDGTIRVWSLPDMTCLAVKTDHGIAVNCVSFTHDGKYLLSAADDHTVKVWSVPQFEVVKTLRGHNDYVSKVFPAGDGRAVSCGKDGTARLWDLATGECIHVMEQTGWVTCLGTSRDGRRAIAGSDRNIINMWDLATGQVERVLLDMSGNYIGEVMGLTLSSDNVSGVGHKHAAKQIIFGPGDKTFLSCEEDLVEWDVETGAEHGRTDGDGWTLAGIAIIPDRATTLRAHADEIEREFVGQLETGAEDARIAYGDWLEERGRIAEANSVRRHGAFRYVFAGTNDAVHVLDLGQKAIVAQAAWEHGDVHNVAVSPDGRLAASGSHKGPVAIWEIDAILAAGMPDRHLSRPVETAIANDGTVLTGTSNRMVRLWNPSGTRNERLPPPSSLFAKVDFSPDDRLAVVLAEGALQVYDAKTAEQKGSAAYAEKGYRPFNKWTILRDGHLLAGSMSGALALWPLEPPAPPVMYDGPEADHVTAWAIDEDQDLVVTGEYADNDKPMQIKFWSIADRKCTLELEFKASATQYTAGATIFELDGETLVAFTTSTGGLFVLDREGEVRCAMQVASDYVMNVMALPDGNLVVGSTGPTLVDVRAKKVLGRIEWPDTYAHFITGTTRAAITSNAGLGLVDFATSQRWEQMPVPSSSVTPSRDGKLYVLSGGDEATAGMPSVARLTV